MRTKTLLLTAIVSAGAMLAAYAQSNVYSVNVVGYVTETVTHSPGDAGDAGGAPAEKFKMLANPLINQQNPNPTINELIPVAPVGAQAYLWNGTTYLISTFDDLLEPPAWDVDTVIPAGQGFFYKHPPGAPDLQVTWVGEVAEGTNSNKTIPSGFSMQGSLVPIAGGISSVHGLPGEVGAQAYKYVGGAQGYVISSFDDLLEPPDWDVDFTLEVGEGIWVRLVSAMPWTRNFDVPE